MVIATGGYARSTYSLIRIVKYRWIDANPLSKLSCESFGREQRGNRLCRCRFFWKMMRKIIRMCGRNGATDGRSRHKVHNSDLIASALAICGIANSPLPLFVVGETLVGGSDLWADLGLCQGSRVPSPQDHIGTDPLKPLTIFGRIKAIPQ